MSESEDLGLIGYHLKPFVLKFFPQWQKSTLIKDNEDA